MADPDTADALDALALDYVLGILTTADLTAARCSEVSDPAFAARVAAHRIRLFPESDAAKDGDDQPRPATWEAIAARIATASDS
jgi:anti-sigma-K factor RskA